MSALTLPELAEKMKTITYCVTKGEVGAAAEQPAQAVLLQFRVTEVQAQINAACAGPKLSADMRGCVRSSVIF